MPRLSVRARSRRVLQLLLLAASFHASGCAKKSKLADIRPLDRKVLFLGIDGLDFDLLKPLFDQGQLPKLAELRKRGLVVPLYGDRASTDPFSAGLDPAEGWTTIATGVTATRLLENGGAHGIANLLVPMKGSYGALPATSQHRQAMTFWDVLGATGVRCAIVGWWTTWPAEPVNGYLVTDRFFLEKFGLTGFGAAGRVDLPRVPESYRRGAEHLTWPEALTEPLAAALAPMVASPAGPVFQTIRDLKELAKGPKAGAETLRNLEQLEQALRTDSAVKDALVSLLQKDPSIRFAAGYLDALDVACHLFWMHIKPEPWLQHASKSIRDKLPGDYPTFARVIPVAALTIDAMVQQICAAMGDDTIVVIVSDHTLDTDTETWSRDFDLDPLLEKLGLLARTKDGAIDWSKTTCFDRTDLPRNYLRRLSINYEGEWPQGSIPAESPQARAIRWRQIQKMLHDIKLDPPYRITDPARGTQEIDTLFFSAAMGEDDSHFGVVQILPGEQRIKLPGSVTTMDALFPLLPSSARHLDPGTLLLSHPGERGDRQGKRGVPMGKGGASSRHVAPLLLALHGIPLSQREDESAPSAELLHWLLELDEAQRMALAPRVESYEELVGFDDPARPLGKRRAELKKVILDLGYEFEIAEPTADPAPEHP